MHYRYTNETISWDNVRIEGLTDISFYSSLNLDMAKSFYETAVLTIRALLELHAPDKDKLPFRLQSWTSILPGSRSFLQ